MKRQNVKVQNKWNFLDTRYSKTAITSVEESIGSSWYREGEEEKEEEQGYLVDSIEDGIRLIVDGQQNKAVFAGRETLYFNIQQFGIFLQKQTQKKKHTQHFSIA